MFKITWNLLEEIISTLKSGSEEDRQLLGERIKDLYFPEEFEGTTVIDNTKLKEDGED